METKQAWDDEVVSVSRAAALVGIAASTLRQYEDRGLIRVAFRTPGGHRRYFTRDVVALRELGSAPKVVPPWLSDGEAVS